MGNISGFDADKEKPAVDFSAIPEGIYSVVITESGMETTKAGNGQYLKLVFEIIEGEFHSRKLWENLCLEHSNEKAVQIARGKLSAICRAVCVRQPQDSSDLHGIPLKVKVGQKMRKDTGEISNVIKSFLPADNTSAIAKPVADELKPPWKK